MVRDVFIEEIVKKKKEPLDCLKIIAILVLCLALAVGFLFLGMFSRFAGSWLDSLFILVISLSPAVRLNLNTH